MNKRIGKRDLIFLVVVIVGCLIFLLIFNVLTQKKGQKIIVEVDKQEWGTFFLDEDKIIEITNEEGVVTNKLIIKDGKADMVEANCPDKLCVHQKAISLNNQTIVCLPNKVVVTVDSYDTAEVDAISN